MRIHHCLEDSLSLMKSCSYLRERERVKEREGERGGESREEGGGRLTHPLSLTNIQTHTHLFQHLFNSLWALFKFITTVQHQYWGVL